jgi:hypothetical protein
VKTPTLGYEEDTVMSKREIASVQLAEAIALFVKKQFLCALTLAGAAEEVFAGLLRAQGEKSVVERSVERIESIRETTGLAVMGNRPRNEIYKHWNSARNRVKHHDKVEQDNVAINLFDEAYWMIRRALANASALKVTISNELDFENWCIEQIHL